MWVISVLCASLKIDYFSIRADKFKISCWCFILTFKSRTSSFLSIISSLFYRIYLYVNTLWCMKKFSWSNQTMPYVWFWGMFLLYAAVAVTVFLRAAAHRPHWQPLLTTLMPSVWAANEHVLARIRTSSRASLKKINK